MKQLTLKHKQLGFIGSVISAAAGFLGQKSANDSNQDNFDTNLAFQRETAQKAHQWQVKDLRKAGLNPILSAKYGGATPSGGSSLPNIQNTAKAGLETKSLEAAINKMNAEADLSSAKEQTEKTQAWKNMAEGSLADKRSEEISGHTPKIKAEIKRIEQETKNMSELQVIHKQNQVLKILETKIAATKDQHDKEILAQLKTKMAEHKGKEQFWKAVGPYMLYADQAVKGAAAAGTLATILKIFQKKAPNTYNTINKIYNRK